MGPISMIGARRVLNRGRLAGFFSGLGSISVDILYGILAGFGITLVSNVIIQYHIFFRLAIAAVLIIWGVKYVIPHELNTITLPKSRNLARDFLSTFVLTVSNPVSILFFPTLFANFNFIVVRHNYSFVLLFMVGVLVGSVLWWILLCELIHRFKQKIIVKIPLLNQIFGVVMIIFGILALITLNRFQIPHS
jgi:threonine/homoserine/homoserine lactone efflux protein